MSDGLAWLVLCSEGGHRWRVGVVGVARANSTEGPPGTDVMISVQTLVEKNADADVLTEMFGFAAERLIEL